MPVLKPISGHTDCQDIKRYLEKDGRALAHDFFNLSWDDREDDDDEELKRHIEWADEMDLLRREKKNDIPFGSMRARTFKHFVISPDPEDGIDLASLRELACSWALKHFGEYQVAIVYHDDNASGIPHAHVVVNNTNVMTGRRMQTRFPLDLNRDLQEMARERELRFLTDAPEPVEGLERLASKGRPAKTRPKSKQQIYIGRAERELAESGGYSWVADVRNRVSVAKSLARNEGEFRQILGMLGVDVADNSRKAKRDDWLFSLTDAPTRKVSGERLGLLFAKETIQRELKRAGSYHPDAKSSRELLKNARNAIIVQDLGDLSELSASLRTCALNNVSSIQECDCKIEAMHRRSDSFDGRRKARFEASIAELESARDYMAKRNLLPQRVEKRPKASTRPTANVPAKTVAPEEQRTASRNAELQRQQRERRQR